MMNEERYLKADILKLTKEISKKTALVYSSDFERTKDLVASRNELYKKLVDLDNRIVELKIRRLLKDKDLLNRFYDDLAKRLEYLRYD